MISIIIPFQYDLLNNIICPLNGNLWTQQNQPSDDITTATVTDTSKINVHFFGRGLEKLTGLELTL